MNFNRMYDLAITLSYLKAQRQVGLQCVIADNAEMREDSQVLLSRFGTGIQLEKDSKLAMSLEGQHEVTFVAYHHGVPVGTMRLSGIMSGSVAEDLFDLNMFNYQVLNHRSLEVTGFAIDSRYAEGDEVFFSLMSAAFLYSAQSSCENWIFAGNTSFARTFERVTKVTELADQLKPSGRRGSKEYLEAMSAAEKRGVSCYLASLNHYSTPNALRNVVKSELVEIRERVKKVRKDSRRMEKSAMVSGMV